MFSKLLPKEFSFFELFEQQSEFIIEAAKELYEFSKGNTTLEASSVKIKNLEHQADNVVHKCLDSLQKTFITPFERTDILSLTKRLDDIIDSIYAAILRIELYEITSIRPAAKDMSALILKCSLQVADVVKSLRNMKNGDTIITKCVVIHELESEGDAIFRTAINKLFKENDAVLIIKWKDVYDKLERTINRSEEVANIIERLVIAAS